MNKEEHNPQLPPERTDPITIKLPGFVLKQDIGVGDLIKKTTAHLGIQPCGGCERRAEWLNRRWVLSRKGS